MTSDIGLFFPGPGWPGPEEVPRMTPDAADVHSRTDPHGGTP